MADCNTCEYENICTMPEFVRNNLKDCKVYEPKKKNTYADKIRTMSDEELAEFIIKIRDCCSTNYCEGCPFDKNGCSKEKICDWLQSEAE